MTTNLKILTAGPGFTATDDDLVSATAVITAANLTLLGGSPVINAGDAEFVIFTATGDASATTYTITGTNNEGAVITEQLIGPADTTPLLSRRLYKEIVTINSSDAVGGVSMKVGWSYSGETTAFPVNNRQSPFNMSVSTRLLSGTGTASIQYTFDNPYAAGITDFNGTAYWRTLSDISSVIGDADATIIGPVTALRGVITSGTAASFEFTFLQGQNG